jgi:hypothetical protein
VSDGLEWLLCDCAPDVSGSEEHRRSLRVALEVALRYRQRPRQPWLAAACFVALLVVIGRPISIGSDDLEVSLSRIGSASGPVYTPVLGRQEIFGGKALAESDPATVQAAVAAFRQSSLALEGRVVGVTGWGLAGGVLFLVDYALPLDDLDGVLTQEAVYPGSGHSEQHEDFFRRGGPASFQQCVQEGRARFLGSEDRFVDGQPIEFKIWTAELPRWGLVSFWAIASEKPDSGDPSPAAQDREQAFPPCCDGSASKPLR